MSFAGDVKQEILSVRPKARLLRQAQAYGLFAFAQNFSPDAVSLHTENCELARLYREYLRVFSPRGCQPFLKEATRQGRLIYQAGLSREQDCRALFARMAGSIPDAALKDRFQSQEETAALLSGAFLSCGNLSDPEKSYHLEFAVREQLLAGELEELLETVAGPCGRTRRRGIEIVYYKECSQIEDLLTLMGASRASLSMIDIEITKQVRNRAMRVTNCETANIDKMVRASTSQVEDIELILKTKGLESLPAPLQEAALIRLENPEMSLRELTEAFAKPISRSGVHHRLAGLSKIAAQIREEGEDNQ